MGDIRVVREDRDVSTPVWVDTWRLYITYVGDPAVYTRIVVTDDMATVLDSARHTVDEMGYRLDQLESVKLERV